MWDYVGTSAVWLFSVVVMGIIVNVISAYIKPLVDEQWGKISDAQRVKNVKKRAVIGKVVARMLADPTYFMWQNTLLITFMLSLSTIGISISLFAVIGMLPANRVLPDELIPPLANKFVKTATWLVWWYRYGLFPRQGIIWEFCYIVMYFLLIVAMVFSSSKVQLQSQIIHEYWRHKNTLESRKNIDTKADQEN